MTRPSPASGGDQPGGSRPGSRLAMPTPSGFIGRYQTLERIAEGGMGSLYLARDPAIDRLVAIKLLRRGFDTEAMRERFAREARAAGRLRHPNIVTIFDVGEHDGDPFIAMEFLAGETLGELIRQGARLSLSRRLKLLEELCDGLAYAHRAGLVHRDVKPANLMVDAGGVLKILDFGIVRVSDSGMTQAGVLVGTINYMSPEQVLGTGVDHRSDIFAVGLVAYELLSGRQAFPGTLKDGLLKRLPNAEIEALVDVVPGLDAEVVAIVERALRKDPADRYQDLTRMRNDCARARDRIQVQEDRAAAEAVAGAGETALIAHAPTSPGMFLEAPQASSPELLADAERAIAEGNYRIALTIAGRAAAIDPHDRTPTAIVERAEAGLLEWSRSVDSSGAGRAPSKGSAAGPATPALSSPTTGQVSTRVTLLAIGLAVMALIVAAVAVWPRLGQQTRDASPPVQPPTAVAGDASGVAAGMDVGGPVNPPEAEPPAAGAESPRAPDPAIPPADASTAPSRQDRRTATIARPPPRSAPPAPTANETVAAPPPAEPMRVGAGVREPRRTHHVPARYPAAALAARAEGTVQVEITIGRDGRVADARVVQSVPLLDEAALAAVRQWQFEPTIVAGQSVVVIDKVAVPFALPDEPKSPAALPAGSASRPAAPAAAEPAESPATSPPARDLRAEAEIAVRDVLRRYTAAWEALDFEAVQRVHALSTFEARAVRETIRGASSYAMDIVVHGVDIDNALRTASADCTITRTFDARIGSIPPQTTRSTVQFERRGDAWMIVSIR